MKRRALRRNKDVCDVIYRVWKRLRGARRARVRVRVRVRVRLRGARWARLGLGAGLGYDRRHSG